MAIMRHRGGMIRLKLAAAYAFLWLVHLCVFCLGDSLVVLSGPSRLAWLPDAEVNLNAKLVNVDGVVETVQWKAEYGPGEVTFETPTQLSTKASFTAAGTYLLRCSVKTTKQNGEYGRVVVEVYTQEQNFGGYNIDFLRQEFGKGIDLKYDFTGYDFQRFREPPMYGRHPRIYLSPGREVSMLRRNMVETDMGRYMMTRINSTLARFKAGEKWAAALEQLNLRSEKDLSLVPVTDQNFISLVGYEIFRAFILRDWTMGIQAVQVMAMACERLLELLKAAKRLRYRIAYDQFYAKYPQLRQLVRVDYREYLQGIVHRKVIATAYDFGFMFMGDKQREKFRALLLTATDGVWSIGMDSLPALQGMRSNWITTTGELLIMTLAVEGEYSTTEDLRWNKEMFARTAAAYERFIGVGYYEDGTSCEGMGKNQIIISALAPLAKRRFPLIASLNVRNHVTKYHAYSVFPWGKNNEYDKPSQRHWTFTWDEALGGTRQPSRYEDIVSLQAAFPKDEKIALIARAEMQDNFSRLNDFNVRVYYKAMEYWHRALFIQPLDTTRTWAEMYQQVMADMPTTYFSDSRGLAIMIDRWHPQALQLHFQPRHVRGGHVHFDRNKICLYGRARPWIECTGSNNPYSYYHAVVRIDGDSRKPDGNPGKMVAKLDNKLASFYAGDVRASYGSYSGLKVNSQGEDLYESFRPFTFNDHRFYPEANHGDVPKWSLPYWKHGLRTIRNNTRSRFHPTQGFVGEMATKAFRTAGLVRGEYPYSLVIDDIQRFDDREATYTWQAPMLRALCRTPELRAEHYSYDEVRRAVTFTDPASPEHKFLLWFVDAASTPKLTWNEMFMYTLEMTVKALKPEFKVLLYPYVEGDALPSVDWDGNQMSVSFFTVEGESSAEGILVQMDIFTFVEDQAGRTRFRVERTHSLSGPPKESSFDFTLETTVSPTGEALRIPDLQNLREPFDKTINNFTAFWEAGLCPSTSLEECTYPH